MSEVTALIQATAAVESATNQIDQLAVLDAEIKRLEAITKGLKADIANAYGEGKHRGEQYGVTITLCNTSKVDYKSLLAELGCTDEQLARFTTTGASIRVSSTK
jgi:uncharacterized protein (UPF0335 family)